MLASVTYLVFLTSASLDEACEARFKDSKSACVEAFKAVERLLESGQVGDAIEIFRKVHDALCSGSSGVCQRGLFKPRAWECWGSLSGGACTGDEWRQLKIREWYSNPDALESDWSALAPLVQKLNERRLEKVAQLYAQSREALRRDAHAEASAAKKEGDALGGQDLQLEDEFRSAWLSEEQKRLEAAGPDAQDGRTKWYKTVAFPTRLWTVPNGCTEAFGTDVGIERTKNGFRCRFMARRVMSQSELGRAKEGMAAYVRLPPAKKRDTTTGWAAITFDTEPCPEGMKRTRVVDADGLDRCLNNHPGTFEETWEHCATHHIPTVYSACEAAMASEDFCASGQFPDTQYSRCLLSECPQGLQSLEQASNGRYQGCYRCPFGGVLDLEQTHAGFLAGGSQAGVYCRVGLAPAKKGKPSTKRR